MLKVQMIQHRFYAAMAVFTLIGGVALAQAPSSGPAFEVASIKPAPPLEPAKIMSGQMHVGMNIDNARVEIGNLSISDLIRIAYKIKPYQIAGPDWMKAQRFDILAKMPEGGTKEQVPEMLQALLAERFQLAIHRENKEHSVYALVVGKGGSKMTEVPPDPVAAADAAPAGPPGSGGMVIGKGENQARFKQSGDGKTTTISSSQMQTKVSVIEGGMMRMEFSKMTMEVLTAMLSQMVDRPVLDVTELKGKYVVALELSMEEVQVMGRAAAAAAGMALPAPPPGKEAGRAPGDAASAPSTSVFAAVQKLGLKLEPRKMPVEIVVVDHVEKMPTEN